MPPLSPPREHAAATAHRATERWLILGGTGLLGTTLALSCRDRGHAVLAMSTRHSFRRSAGIPSVQKNALGLSQADWHELWDFRPTVVVNCIANTSVDRCEADPQARELNAEFPGRVAERCAKLGTRFIHISTDSVYSLAPGERADEDTITAPVNAYAEQKLAGEASVAGANPEAAILRTNFFGWSPMGEAGLANWMLGNLARGEPFNGFTDVAFTPLYTEQLCAVIQASVEFKIAGVFCAGGSEPISKFELGRRLATAFGYDPTLVRASTLASADLAAPRPLNTSLVSTRLFSILQIPPQTLESGLDKMRQGPMRARIIECLETEMT